MTTLDESMNDDLISRDAVLDACSQSINILDAMSRIEDLPSITPKQRTGHWTKDDITERSKSAYKHKCDRCGAYHRAMYDYCPSCGAKMIEPQERSGEE